MKTAVLNAVINSEGAFSPIIRDRELGYWYSVLSELTGIVTDNSGDDIDYYIHVRSGILAPTLNNIKTIEKVIGELSGNKEISLNRGEVIISGSALPDSCDNIVEVAGTVDIITADNFLDLEKRVVNIQINSLLSRNITIENYNNFFLSEDAVVGSGSFIGSGAVIKGKCVIGSNVRIGSNVLVQNSDIADNCTVLHGSVVNESKMEEGVTIGPYTHLRTNVHICRNAKAGNFVEMKKTVFGEGSKAMHLAYLGDADIGKKVNIGAGTITCNYDGKNKNKTVIGDGVFVGSDSQLIAPVELEPEAYIAAGSTITEKVSSGSLALSRVKQREIPGWSARKKLSD